VIRQDFGFQDIRALCRETLVEACLLGQVLRETVLKELGLEQLEKHIVSNYVLE
jgi:hypothetical protein